MNIETMLHDEIRNEFDELKKMELGTEAYKTTVDGLTKLMDKAIEIDKFNTEYQNKIETREIENNIKLKELEDEKKDRLVKNILTGAGVIIPVAVTVWGTFKTFEFEKTGTVTTIMGRGFLNKLLPGKK